MTNFKDIDFNELIKKVIENQGEVSINFEPDRMEIIILPRKPFTEELQ